MSKTQHAQDLIDNPELVTDAPPEQPAQGRETIELDEPIQRGSATIAELQLRKPVAGELRGVSLMELAQMDIEALRKVLPRITAPALTGAEIGSMAPADLMQCGVVVAGFLLTKKQRDQAGSLGA